MNPACVNRGGLQSLVRLDEVPARTEQEVFLSSTSVEKLSCWHARPGEIITVCDPEGRCYRARLTALDKSTASAVIFQPFLFPPESPLRIDVYQALPDKERFELILQKLTELGVFRIIPYLSRKSISLEERDAGQRKSHRWPDVILRAAKQCRRALIPELSTVLSWGEAVDEASRIETRLVLFEKENSRRLKEILTSGECPSHVALFVGPEGGFTSGEIGELGGKGFCPVLLGPRILRTETAAIAGAALVQSYLGDLG